MLNYDNTYYHLELMKDGQGFCSVVEAKDAKYPDYNPIDLDYTFKTREELEHTSRPMIGRRKMISRKRSNVIL